MKITNKKSINEKLIKFDPLAKKDDFIEITAWTNEEGYDISINDKPIISLTIGELEAINYLIESLDYGIE